MAVTRRYYRSGESEYYINKQSVRLKDVNELFMDTGMGREGYSIIGQGKIDEILSVKSGERRRLRGGRRYQQIPGTARRSPSAAGAHRGKPGAYQRQDRRAGIAGGAAAGAGGDGEEVSGAAG